MILDGRLGAARARQMATLADRLGLAGVWIRQPWSPPGAPGMSEADSAGLLASLADSVQVPVGLILDADGAEAGWLESLILAAGPSAGLRVALSGTPAAIARWQRTIGQGQGVAQLALPATVPVVPPFATALDTAVFVPWTPGRDLAAEVSAAAAAAGGRPVLAEVPVSVGRTVAEARARADADELFALADHPAAHGLFGTLEECQAAAAQLAQAGATELLCRLPLADDLPDVLAQLRSIAIGAGVLRPGEPPSAPPPPPDGWGGRRTTA